MLQTLEEAIIVIKDGKVIFKNEKFDLMITELDQILLKKQENELNIKMLKLFRKKFNENQNIVTD